MRLSTAIVVNLRLVLLSRGRHLKKGERKCQDTHRRVNMLTTFRRELSASESRGSLRRLLRSLFIRCKSDLDANGQSLDAVCADVKYGRELARSASRRCFVSDSKETAGEKPGIPRTYQSSVLSPRERARVIPFTATREVVNLEINLPDMNRPIARRKGEVEFR